ncbi:class I SAM-dependent methyltransferase [Brevibacillus porteri]|uniref:Methylase n=1 Tax=Brevibacillus porteri TaxID=2126350 RepID=A0ABX5FH12_9BACL|nr:class I SAM-dependent methyltransferase [Brevibacillus porteri]MED1802440.1 class I SAM-dependent methyltransferase [Brevibacillus porteri]MED2129622.1 class I SAM-dependent methyltransferase [Brevibacillus porteri]MED2747470.1 class I SAM-dependent methyltransferase [Brevibacillus porteri]MED2816977.1 class I SAM-dependent methyltransferase [Brevibacillus porteri]MED2894947.1 class I SAM-dependent methyltransferase [Brevibacillus porteri]
MRKEQDVGVYEQVGVAMTCRSYQEYVDMFSLSDEILAMGPILDVGAGASSFTAEACQHGREAIAVDPLYEMKPEEIYTKGKREIEESTQKLAGIAHTLHWEYYGSLGQHHQNRERSLEQFIAAYRADEGIGKRYVAGLLPELPFADDHFSLVLGSHFLFLYQQQFDEQFHLNAIKELLRICQPGGRIRLYPLIGLDRKPYSKLPQLMEEIRRFGHTASLEPTNFRFLVGATHYLEIRKS